MKRLPVRSAAVFYIGVIACSLLCLSSCKKSITSEDPVTTSTGVAAVTPAVESTSGFKGLNWADPNDNFSSGNVVPSGLSATDNYASTQSKANTILTAFQQQGANTVRLPVNTFTVAGTWWNAYTGAIDAAISKGMNVILAYWEAPGGNGTVADTASFWNMWRTVTNKYSGTATVYFEVFNEPHGYSVTALNNLYAQWLGKYTSVPNSRVLLDGAGYSTNVNGVGADSRLSACLLSYHNYTWFNSSLNTAADWEGQIQGITYPARTIMTEFGIPMTTGNNYLNAPGSNRDIAYFQGITNQLRASGIGGVYWPGLRTGDTYSLLTLSGSTVSVTNSSGLSRLQYAWNNVSINQPYGSFTAGSWYRITNRNSGSVVDINGQSTAAGASAIQWSYWGGNNQQWSFAGLGSGYFNLTNRNSSLRLDVSGASTANGASVIQNTVSTGNSQRWRVIDIGFGYYKLLNQNSNQVLDVNGASTANGATIIQWPSNGGRNQQWQIVAL
ncbi:MULTISPECIES: RICIN domain-containing protein [Niastella]|uniref:RICIN domain-containing protein n=1 Tax=Niastella soli TaxID=2821487 RepID=A0ABS3YWW6_9BACT|nr:RICIN domain-containing protein [Niastella soli]MBO9202424.1 RICIN domain-containing protein [Niastella soli]